MAKLFQLSVSTIRHYEALGLVRPEYVDPDTGYRYYSPEQFEAFNMIRYFRALDMPLTEIRDFFENRDVENVEEKLRQQKKIVQSRMEELRRIEQKIDNRLKQLADARTGTLDVVQQTTLPACRMVFLRRALTITRQQDMEEPVTALSRKQGEPMVFLGKVGVAMGEDRLRSGDYGQYDGIFLLLDPEDQADGELMELEATPAVTIRFRGHHADAPAQYQKLMDHISARNLRVSGFSREITMIDYGITNDPGKFVTEISIPVAE